MSEMAAAETVETEDAVVAPPEVAAEPVEATETEPQEAITGDEVAEAPPPVQIPQEILDVLAGAAPPVGDQPTPPYPQVPPAPYPQQPGQPPTQPYPQAPPPVDPDLAQTNPDLWLAQSLQAAGIPAQQAELARRLQQNEVMSRQMGTQMQEQQQQQVARARGQLSQAVTGHYNDVLGKSAFYTGDENVKKNVDGQYRNMMESAIAHAERTGDTSALQTMSDWQSAEMLLAAGLIQSGVRISQLTPSGQPLKIRGAETRGGKSGTSEPSTGDYFTAEDIADLKENHYTDAQIAEMATAAMAAERARKK